MGLSLSRLIELIGNDNVEVHPLAQCITGGKAKKGVTYLSLTIQTNKISLNELATNSPLQSGGFVILFPQKLAEAALVKWKGETTHD